MADQLVRQRAADACEQEVPRRVLEDRAMADLEDMVDVGLVAAGPRLGEAHVADAAGRLDQVLAGDLGIGLPAHPVIRQEAVELDAVHDLSADEVDGRLADDADVLAWVTRFHEIRSLSEGSVPL